MTTISPTSRWLAAVCLAAAGVAGLTGLTPATPAAASGHSANEGACSFDPAYLPRTPDAVESWYAQCWAKPGVATTSGLPSTPDAVEAWGA